MVAPGLRAGREAAGRDANGDLVARPDLAHQPAGEQPIRDLTHARGGEAVQRARRPGPAWRTCPASWASPSPPSTTTCPARRGCSGWPRAAPWTGCSPRRPSWTRWAAGPSTGSSTWSAAASCCWPGSCRSSPCCCGCAATPRRSGRRWPAAASSTTSWPGWSPRPPPRGTCASTSTRPWPPGCCSAWSTRSSSGTGPAAPPPPKSWRHRGHRRLRRPARPARLTCRRPGLTLQAIRQEGLRYPHSGQMYVPRRGG